MSSLFVPQNTNGDDDRLYLDFFDDDFGLAENNFLDTPHELQRKRARTSCRGNSEYLFVADFPDDPASAPNPPIKNEKPKPEVIDITGDDDVDFTANILELFPDISLAYVEELCARFKADREVTGIVEEVLANVPYPKQKDLKRKKSASEEKNSRFVPEDNLDAMYIQRAARMLAHSFPHVPAPYIRKALTEKKNLYNAYLDLFRHESDPNVPKPYKRLRQIRKNHAVYVPWEKNAPETENDVMIQELCAAKKKAEEEAVALQKKKQEEEAERLNEEEHTRAGTLVECLCCYLDVPLNRSLPCEGTDTHIFCFSCIRRSAETQIGLMRYRLQCFDTSGCQAGYSRSGLQEALGKLLLQKLDSLQQQDEIAKADLDGLEDCPFCEFKAICPPVEKDREFRCSNPECEVISCRLCREETHIPKTCGEVKKDKGISERHRVEEAMSEALIRKCPRCKVNIVKEHGCNKMTCSQCGCKMCYVCKKDISKEQYNHFNRGRNGCRVDDDPNRIRQEIAQAEKEAIERVQAENPDITQEELRVQVQDAKKTKKRAAEYAPARPPAPVHPPARPQLPAQRPAPHPRAPVPAPALQPMHTPPHQITAQNGYITDIPPYFHYGGPQLSDPLYHLYHYPGAFPRDDALPDLANRVAMRFQRPGHLHGARRT